MSIGRAAEKTVTEDKWLNRTLDVRQAAGDKTSKEAGHSPLSLAQREVNQMYKKNNQRFGKRAAGPFLLLTCKERT